MSVRTLDLAQRLDLRVRERSGAAAAGAASAPVRCVFCSMSTPSAAQMLEHWTSVHATMVNLGLSTLDIVGLDELFASVRRMAHVEHRCWQCNRVFGNYALLRSHVKRKAHVRLRFGDRILWPAGRGSFK